MKPMTKISHDFLEPVLKRGACCIDATLGQGSDSAFFLEHPVSRVFAFDIQNDLVEQAKERFKADRRFTAFCLSHAKMDEALNPHQKAGFIDAILFNFGYDPARPNGELTREQSSLEAVKKALMLLRVRGRMALVFYPHEEGKREEARIRHELEGLTGEFAQLEVRAPGADAPSLLLIERRSLQSRKDERQSPRQTG